MGELTFKLPNAKTFDALDEITDKHPDPAVKSLAYAVRDLCDTIIVMNKVIAQLPGVRMRRDTDPKDITELGRDT